MTIKSVSLFYKDSSSDKEYNATIEQKDNGYLVNFSYGRRGNALQSGTKTNEPVALDKAESIYNKLVSEKTSKGYVANGEGKPFSGVDTANRQTGLVPMLLNPITDAELEKYLVDNNWIMQEKYDGKRILVRISNNQVVASNRKGLSVGIPSELEEELSKLEDCVLDGELIGSNYYVFDLLEVKEEEWKTQYCKDRYLKLCELIHEYLPKNIRKYITIAPIHFIEQDKRYMLGQLAKKEGVVFKLDTSLYVAGRPASNGNAVKYKFWNDVTAKVLTINSSKRSVGVGVMSNDKIVSVGNVTIPPNYDIPLIGEYVEVKYLYAYENGSLYQPIYRGARNDKDCADELSTLKFKSEDEDS